MKDKESTNRLHLSYTITLFTNLFMIRTIHTMMDNHLKYINLIKTTSYFH